MDVRRVRTFAVTVAMVLGAGTMSSFAAPMLQTAATEDATEATTEVVTEDPTEPVEESSEPVEETTTDDADNQERRAAREARAKAKAAAAKAERDAAKVERKAAQAQRKEAKTNNGKGNAHGKAVSDAARGVTEPVGDCRNHGHWVSTVAKGKDSCDDNPRPPKGADD